MKEETKCRHKKLSHYVKLFAVILFLVLSQNLFAAHSFYWDKVKTVSARDSHFPRTLTYGNRSYVFWEEVDASTNQIWISERIYTSTSEYVDKIRFAGPFNYSGEVPDIYSVAVSSAGTVIV